MSLASSVVILQVYVLYDAGMSICISRNPIVTCSSCTFNPYENFHVYIKMYIFVMNNEKSLCCRGSFLRGFSIKHPEHHFTVPNKSIMLKLNDCEFFEHDEVEQKGHGWRESTREQGALEFRSPRIEISILLPLKWTQAVQLFEQIRERRTRTMAKPRQYEHHPRLAI